MGRGKGADRVEGSVNRDAKESLPERLQKLGSIMLLNIARKFFCGLVLECDETALDNSRGTGGFRTCSGLYGQYSDAENYCGTQD